MFNDLQTVSMPRIGWFIRRAMLFCVPVVVLGLGTIGVSRTQPATPARQEPTELLHNISTPTLVTPEIPGRVMMMEVTAYCACPKCCGPKAAGITASGRRVSYNAGKFVAADTSVLPFGTRLLVPGYFDQPVEVIDRGGAIRGNKLDVFFSSHEEALKWGRQFIPVLVLE